MLKRIALGLAVVILCGASNPPSPGPAKGGHKPQTQGAAEQPKTQVDQRGTKAAPLVVLIPSTPEDHAKETQEAQREKDSAAREGLLVIFTGVLTLATVVLAVFTFGLWNATTKAVKDSSKGIRIARKSAKAARRSADIAERNLAATQAAYVFMEDLRIVKHVRGETGELSHINFAPFWRNSGRTQTRFLYNWVSMDFRLGALPDEFDFPDVGETVVQRLYIGPRSAISGGEASLTIADLQQIGPGWTVTVWGWVEYDDIFANTPRHRSEFAVAIEFLDTPSATDTQILWKFYKRHNGSDAECEKPLKTNAEGLLKAD